MTRLVLPPSSIERVRQVLREGAEPRTLIGPEEVHVAAAAWNWDGSLAPLMALVSRPDCALATASLVFWRSLPDEGVGFYADAASVDEDAAEAFALQRLILGRAASYPSFDIGFDPADDDGTNWRETYPESPAHPLPDLLLEPVVGRHRDPSLRF